MYISMMMMVMMMMMMMMVMMMVMMMMMIWVMFISFAELSKDVPLVAFMYLLFTRMPCESYRRRLRSLLLFLCDVFRALINSLFLLVFENCVLSALNR